MSKLINRGLAFAFFSTASLLSFSQGINAAETGVAGTITGVNVYSAKTSSAVDGKFNKNVAHVKLQVNDRIVGDAKTVHPVPGLSMGTFSVPVQKGLINTRDDKVVVIAYNDKNAVVDQKNVTVLPDPNNGLLLISPYSLSSAHSIDGRYQGDVKMLEIEINGKKAGRMNVSASQNFSLPVSKGLITQRTDRVNLISYNGKAAKISTTKVTLFP